MEIDRENRHILNQLVRNDKNNSLVLYIQIYAQIENLLYLKWFTTIAALESMFIKMDTVLGAMQWL